MGKSHILKVLAAVLPAVLIVTGMVFYFRMDKKIPEKQKDPSHPFLIVKPSDYEELRSRASQEPWKTFKYSAIADAKSLEVYPSASYVTRCTSIREIMDSCSLAYILDPGNKQRYIDKILDTFKYWSNENKGNIYSELNRKDWTYAVPPGGTFFSCVLALDIINPDLSPDKLTSAEIILQKAADWFWNNDMNWIISQWGARGIWSLYKDETSRFELAKNEYYKQFMNYTSADGVGLPGIGYSNARFSSDRNAKQYFMDVLTYTGQYDYYSDPKAVKFYEWLYGYGATAFRGTWIFGDSTFNNTYGRTSSIYKAGNFSEDAAKYAAWAIEGYTTARGRLMNYVLLRTNATEAVRAKSKIFTDGGAYFFEDSQDKNALGIVLWNSKGEDGHSHKEVNSINAAAFGEYLLVNAGYSEWGKGALGFSWTYMHDRAVSGNTALIDYQYSDSYDPPAANDHQSKHGEGVAEGFISEHLSYASADSGSALPNGKHLRNLVAVSPVNSKNGYWVLFDELSLNTQGKTANIALHPPTTRYTVVSPDEEYQWTVSRVTGRDVSLSMFLGTAPASAAIKDGVVGSFGYSFLTKYLYSTYNIDSASGKKNIVTVLFPSDATHVKAGMSRITGPDYSGAGIKLDAVTTDYVLESSGTGEVSYSGAAFTGAGTLFRKASDSVQFYFVRKGKSFNEGSSVRKGFTSAGTVSIYMNGEEGNIVSPGTDVTFYYPGIKGVGLDGKAAAVKAAGNGSVTVNVPAGTYLVTLTKG